MIKNILFDLGNVLVNVDFDKFKSALLKEGVSGEVFKELFYSKELKDKFESGSISNAEFLNFVCSKLDCKISKKKFIEIFSDMFTEIPEMRKFIEDISKKDRYKLIMLSNTNAYHFNYIRKSFDYIKSFKNFALSYRMKMIKPSSAIYLNVLKRYRIKAGETLFIDDLEDNCKAAEAIGIKTICFKDYKSFKKKFDKLDKTLGN